MCSFVHFFWIFLKNFTIIFYRFEIKEIATLFWNFVVQEFVASSAGYTNISLALLVQLSGSSTDGLPRVSLPTANLKVAQEC